MKKILKRVSAIIFLKTFVVCRKKNINKKFKNENRNRMLISNPVLYMYKVINCLMITKNLYNLSRIYKEKNKFIQKQK